MNLINKYVSNNIYLNNFFSKGKRYFRYHLWHISLNLLIAYHLSSMNFNVVEGHLLRILVPVSHV